MRKSKSTKESKSSTMLRRLLKRAEKKLLKRINMRNSGTNSVRTSNLE